MAIPHLGRYTKEIDKLERFLLENEVAEKKYVVTCPCCCEDEWLSSSLSLEKNRLDKLLTISEANFCDAEDEFESIVDCICEECGYSPDYYEMRDYERNERIRFKELLKMKMERDKSLDNV